MVDRGSGRARASNQPINVSSSCARAGATGQHTDLCHAELYGEAAQLDDHRLEAAGDHTEAGEVARLAAASFPIGIVSAALRATTDRRRLPRALLGIRAL